MKRSKLYYISVFILAFTLLFSMTACSNKNAKLDYANMKPEDLIKDFKDKKELTDEDFEWLMSTYQYVPIDENLIISDDNITTKAFKLLRKAEIKYSCSEESMKKLLASEYPQVRAKTFGQMASLFGTSKEDKALAIEALKTEKEPCVLKAALMVLGNSGEDPEIGEFMLNMAKHENPKIRKQAAYSIGSSWNIKMKGALDAELALLKDADKEVVKTACKSCGNLADEKVIEPLVEFLDNEELYNLHGNCMESLSKLWLHYPFHENTSEKAYRASMNYFKKTPRNEHVPAWLALSSISNISKSNIDEWKKKATYYNPKEIIDAMTDILKDPKADLVARKETLFVIKTHGGKKALEALKPVVDKLSDDKASTIKSALESHLKENN